MSDYGYTKEFEARAAELVDIAAMDRLARDLAPESSLRHLAEQRDRFGRRTRLSRWSRRQLHPPAA